MANQILFTEKVRNPQNPDEWIGLRRVIGDEQGSVIAIQMLDVDGNPMDIEPIDFNDNPLDGTLPLPLGLDEEERNILRTVSTVKNFYVDNYGRLLGIDRQKYQIPVRIKPLV